MDRQIGKNQRFFGIQELPGLGELHVESHLNLQMNPRNRKRLGRKDHR